MTGIKMEMPKTCSNCILAGEEGDEMVCLATGKTIRHGMDQREASCPLYKIEDIPLDQLPFASQQEEKE